jgi:hypothetical protein
MFIDRTRIYRMGKDFSGLDGCAEWQTTIGSIGFTSQNQDLQNGKDFRIFIRIE